MMSTPFFVAALINQGGQIGTPARYSICASATRKAELQTIATFAIRLLLL